MSKIFICKKLKQAFEVEKKNMQITQENWGSKEKVKLPENAGARSAEWIQESSIITRDACYASDQLPLLDEVSS